jgi:transposase
MSARERLPNQRLSESFGVEYALDVRQAPQASCQRQELITTGEQHRCTPPRPDAKLAVDTHQLESAEILRARRLLDENVSLERAWSEMQASRGRAAGSTVEALLYSLRAGGTALASPHTRRRLSELSEAQLHEVAARLQKFQSNIARAWTPVEVEFLVTIWIDLHG